MPDRLKVNWVITNVPSVASLMVAKKLMDFAEDYAIKYSYSSVRLDGYSGNERVLRFYENGEYKKRGQVFFRGRKHPFYCYEKQLKQNKQTLITRQKSCDKF